MKMRALFDLITDAKEISDLFAKIETPEQMVSFLERLKKQGPAEFLDAVQALRLSTEAVLEDTFELGGPIGDMDDEDDEGDDGIGDGDVDEELLGEEAEVVEGNEKTDTRPAEQETKS